jgi:hypothetical protein
MFTAGDYQTLHSIVFATDADGRPRYPGYRPELVEYPSKDGTPDERDRMKRFAHVAFKYLDTYAAATEDTSEHVCILRDMLDRCHAEALRVAKALGLPEAFTPRIEYSALRILDYPPGAGTQLHTDFNLFTLLCYRDRPEGLVRYSYDGIDEAPAALDAIAPGLHIGELGEIVGLGPATPHEVVPVYEPLGTAGTWEMFHGAAPAPQHSIVYFAIPDHDAVLNGEPGGWLTVGQWLAERMARSRAPK